MNRLLFLTTQTENARLVRDWLGGTYGFQVSEEVPAAANDFDLVIGEDGTLVEQSAAVRELRREQAPVLLPVLFLTSRDSVGLHTEDLWEVVDDILLKPVEKLEMGTRIKVLLRTRRMSLRLQQRQKELRRQLDDVEGELSSALSDIERVNRGALEALAGTLHLRHVETMEHCRRVARLSLRLGRVLNLSEEELGHLQRGALLHDIGKIGIPDGILLKPQSLSEHEWGIIKTHPREGYRLLEDIPFLEEATKIVLHHHERWDGTGYPDGISGTEIPRNARIFSVADAHDAMAADRPYRQGLPMPRVREEIRRNAGSQFDPGVAEAYLQLEPG